MNMLLKFKMCMIFIVNPHFLTLYKMQTILPENLPVVHLASPTIQNVLCKPVHLQIIKVFVDGCSGGNVGDNAVYTI